ncbi:MAG: hypothetical protein M3041_09635 [Acidobacteriota bacterium]|nr:hypothetical protein [Acidobacteriota bacterium]
MANRTHMTRPKMTAAAMVAAVIAIGETASGADLTAAYRTPATCFLMSGAGEIYEANPREGLKKLFVLSDATGEPYHWINLPRSFVQWKSEWLVTDMSNRVVRFSAKGMWVGFIPLPFRAATLTVVGNSLWSLNHLATSPTNQLWRSTDGMTFTPVNVFSSTERFHSPLRNLLLVAGDGAGKLYVMPIIGPPILHQAYPAMIGIQLAYSRSKQREVLQDADRIIADVTPYSLPARDLFPLDLRGIVVLRNREDVRSASGTLELWLGRRADRYDDASHHVATALFPQSVHWIVGVTPTTVIGVDRSGHVVSATWGKPVRGEIITP